MTDAPMIVKVKPLVWDFVSLTQTWQSKSAFGEYSVGFDDGWWAQLDGPSNWDWEPPEDRRSYYGPTAAKAAAQADYEARILAALDIAPDPRVAALVQAAAPYVAPMQTADYARQCRQHDALDAALAAFKGDAQ